MLHLDMCARPCWAGITPGKATFAEADRRIRQLYSEAGYTITGYGTTYTIWSKAQNIAFTVQFNGANEVIGDIFLSFSDLWGGEYWLRNDKVVLSFGELNNLWGSSHFISPDIPQCFGTWLPKYNDLKISRVTVATSINSDRSNSITANARVSLDSPVTAIVIPTDSENPTNWKSLQGWGGYVVFSQYDYEDKRGGC